MNDLIVNLVSDSDKANDRVNFAPCIVVFVQGIPYPSVNPGERKNYDKSGIRI